MYLGKQTWQSPFKVKLWENQKNSYFPKHTLPVSLQFGLRVSLIFLQGYQKVWIIVGKNLWRIEITYFLSTCLWDPNYNYSMAKKLLTVIFSWPGCIFLGKGVLEICNKFKEQNPCQKAIALYGCSPVNFWHIFRTTF